jgi:hypothetical protein
MDLPLTFLSLAKCAYNYEISVVQYDFMYVNIYSRWCRKNVLLFL